MTQQIQSRRNQEQKIKSRLYNIQFEQSQTNNLPFRPYQIPQPPPHPKYRNYAQISDWSSNFHFNATGTFKQPQPKSQQKDQKRLTFFNFTRYPSSLLKDTKKDTRLQLSPIVVKFNAKILNQNLQQSKQKYMKRLKQDPYISHYQSSKLFQNKRKSQSQMKQIKRPEVKQLKFEGGEMHNQRMTGILRLLKKDVPFRSRPKKPHNPQTFLNTTRNFF